MPAGTRIVSGPERAFVTWIAARSVHVPALVLQTASPTLASTLAAALFTLNVAAPTYSAVSTTTTDANSSVVRIVRSAKTRLFFSTAIASIEYPVSYGPCTGVCAALPET